MEITWVEALLPLLTAKGALKKASVKPDQPPACLLQLEAPDLFNLCYRNIDILF